MGAIIQPCLRLQNDSFLRACLRQPTEPTPRLADAPGRPLPAGIPRARAKAGSFMGLATNTDFATEVTLQPLDRYDAGCGHPVQRHPHRARRDGPGPELRASARAEASPSGARRRAGGWPCADMDKLRATCSMPSRRSGALQPPARCVPLIGFSGSPGRWPATWSRAPARTTTGWSRPCCTAGRT